jgi:hypothetical protein
MDDTLALAAVVAKILGSLGVPYFIGGSLASSQHGVPRATLDADIVARLSPGDVRPLLAALGDAWYADEAAVRDALGRASSFNLIHIRRPADPYGRFGCPLEIRRHSGGLGGLL